MENKELYRGKIEQKIVSVDVIEEELIFTKEDNTTIKISYSHNQECCENVYADFEYIDYYRANIVNKSFKEIVIKSVEGMGFLICLYENWDKGEKIFIPCYNEQNGYYGDNLTLNIENEGKTENVDISNLTEYHDS